MYNKRSAKIKYNLIAFILQTFDTLSDLSTGKTSVTDDITDFLPETNVDLIETYSKNLNNLLCENTSLREVLEDFNQPFCSLEDVVIPLEDQRALYMSYYGKVFNNNPKFCALLKQVAKDEILYYNTEYPEVNMQTYFQELTDDNCKLAICYLLGLHSYMSSLGSVKDADLYKKYVYDPLFYNTDATEDYIYSAIFEEVEDTQSIEKAYNKYKLTLQQVNTIFSYYQYTCKYFLIADTKISLKYSKYENYTFKNTPFIYNDQEVQFDKDEYLKTFCNTEHNLDLFTRLEELNFKSIDLFYQDEQQKAEDAYNYAHNITNEPCNFCGGRGCIHCEPSRFI